MKSFFDFIGRPNPKCIADCPETQKLETPTKKRCLLLVGVEVPEVLGGELDERLELLNANRYRKILADALSGMKTG